jgi:hypothetical protein
MDSKAAQAAFKARQLPAKEAALFKTLLVRAFWFPSTVRRRNRPTDQ